LSTDTAFATSFAENGSRRYAPRDLAQQSGLRILTHPRREEVVQLGEDEGREQQRPVVTVERFPGRRVKTLVCIQDSQ
jgi:hypothetical protein